jgi:hypothetical protein
MSEVAERILQGLIDELRANRIETISVQELDDVLKKIRSRRDRSAHLMSRPG